MTLEELKWFGVPQSVREAMEEAYEENARYNRAYDGWDEEE